MFTGVRWKGGEEGRGVGCMGKGDQMYDYSAQKEPSEIIVLRVLYWYLELSLKASQEICCSFILSYKVFEL